MSNTDPTKKQRWTQVLVKGKQFLLLIRHPQCYSPSLEERKNLCIKEKIHCHLRYGYFVFCVVLWFCVFFVSVLCLCPVLPVSLNCPFLIALSIFSNFYYIPARREFGVYRDPHVRPSIRHTFGFGIIIQVPLNQVFSNFHTLLCTIKYRLSLITVHFTFTVHELWSFFT
jgi:hypothetical protein